MNKTTLDRFKQGFYYNYHKHTDYSNISTSDSVAKVEHYLKRAKELGHDAYFTGEHGWQGDIFTCRSLCDEYGLKCIYSVEAYYVDDMYDRSSRKNYHIVLVAKTERARKEINKILSKANTDGFYYKPRIDLNCLLSLTPEDTIVTSACFTKGNKVLTDKGYINIENIKRGDKVKNKFGQWEFVNYPTRIDYKGVGYTINVEGSIESFTCTQDHKFLVSSINDMVDRKTRWMSANEINYYYHNKSNNSKPYFLLPITTNYTMDIFLNKKDWYGSYHEHVAAHRQKYVLPNTIKITRELMTMFGFFLGDGHITLKGYPRVGFTINYEEFDNYYNDFFRPVEEQLGIKFNCLKRKKYNRIDLTTSSTDFFDLFYYLFGNCKAHNKCIPDRLLHINKELDYALLFGMLLSDGNFNSNIADKKYKTGRMTYVTISKILANQIIELCDSLKIKTVTHLKDEYVDKNKIHHCTSYYIYSNANYWGKLNKKDKISFKEFCYNLNCLYDNQHNKPFVMLNNVFYKKVRIKNIEEIYIDDEVYCLNNNTHSFVLNNVIAHNCIASRMFKGSDWEEKFLIPVYKYFGKNFFLEVQAHVDSAQAIYNKMILDVHEKYGIPLIHANDSHYIYPKEAEYRSMYIKAKGMKYGDEDNFILDYPSVNTIVQRYLKQGVLTKKQIVEAITNTYIFDECDDIYLDKEIKLPKIVDDNSNKYLAGIIDQAWKHELPKVKKDRIPQYLEAIKDEFQTIVDCNMADYFILDHEIVKKAVNDYGAILTRSGRGSGVSFIVNKFLGLTEVDRIKAPVKLYPSRFMSAERIITSRSLPDFDINCANQEPLLQASRDILGEDGAYFMVAYGTMKESQAFRTWCKALDLNHNEYNEIGKNLDEYRDNPKWSKIIEDSSVFVDVIDSISPSPCSVLLLDKEISKEIGLIRVGDEKSKSYRICCCLDGINCDKYKYVKND